MINVSWSPASDRDQAGEHPVTDEGGSNARGIGRLPDFFVIGAMKSATTTLHVQLSRQLGLFMSDPKEPNYFSDDEQFARGLAWYSSLFQDADCDALCGESSTHYTKLPAFPRTVERLARTLPRPRLIYVMRHPIDRLISHYVHEKTTGRITRGILDALEKHPELIDYGRYGMQLEPYLDTFGPGSVLPVFFGRLVAHAQAELERICRFIGYSGKPAWDWSIKPQNVGSERLRRSLLRETLVQAPLLTKVRRSLLPRSWSEPIKSLWRARIDPPGRSPALIEHVRSIFDADLARLGRWLGIHLDCENFSAVTLDRLHDWAGAR
jgi:hypothetical protein